MTHYYIGWRYCLAGYVKFDVKLFLEHSHRLFLQTKKMHSTQDLFSIKIKYVIVISTLFKAFTFFKISLAFSDGAKK